jgi:hypothetical protein
MPRGRRCSSRTEGRAQPAPAATAGQSFNPAPVSHRQGPASRGINEGSHDSPVRASPRLWPPGWNGPPSGFPLGFAPRRPGAGRCTPGAGIGRRARTWNDALRHQPNLQSRVFTQCVRPRVAPSAAGVSYRSPALPQAWRGRRHSRRPSALHARPTQERRRVLATTRRVASGGSISSSRASGCASSISKVSRITNLLDGQCRRSASGRGKLATRTCSLTGRSSRTH